MYIEAKIIYLNKIVKIEVRKTVKLVQQRKFIG